MKRSTNRILTTHIGTLPGPDDVRQMVAAKAWGQPVDEQSLQRRLREAIAENARKQVELGIDIINDGELSKILFNLYARQRIGGIETRERDGGEFNILAAIAGRDMPEFSEFILGAASARANPGQRQISVCTGPLTYTGQAEVQADIENLKAAVQAVEATEVFMTAVAPGTLEHLIRNEYYPSEEDFVFALADVLHEEYRAIVDAGFILQIDDPDLATGWQLHPEMEIGEYRRFAEVRIEAINRALRDIPAGRARIHMCWGAYHGPHVGDIPLKEVVDLILRVRVEGVSLEAGNPRHEHEWRVWETVKLPEDKVLIPGVVGHATDFIEHPELVAERLVRFARLVGRENVIAGTDCGLGGKVSHPAIAWAKLRALAEGAALASKELW